MEDIFEFLAGFHAIVITEGAVNLGFHENIKNPNNVDVWLQMMDLLKHAIKQRRWILKFILEFKFTELLLKNMLRVSNDFLPGYYRTSVEEFLCTIVTIEDPDFNFPGLLQRLRINKICEDYNLHKLYELIHGN